MWRSVKALIFKPGFLLAVYAVCAVLVSVQLISFGTHPFTFPTDPVPDDIMNHPEYMNLFVGKQLTEYNNYLIFKNSFFHLLHGTNLYGIYPSEHWDFYKYSPTFALCMGAIAYLPDVVGLSIWNLANVLVLVFAIRRLPYNNKTICIILWFILNEALTMLSNTQSNGLMCGLMIAAYASLENGKAIWATLWLVIATYIKVYGAIGFCLFLFYPDKIKFILYAILWSVVLFVLPLIVTPMQTLLWQYQNWLTLMKADATEAVGLSVAGVLRSWFGLRNVMAYITLGGMVLFLVPFARIKMYSNEVFRLLILASMLIWVIIFNHKAESSTYIIAVPGVCIWYYAMPKAKWRTVLLFTVLIFTCLSTTDLFPPIVKRHFIYPYKIKTVPCILAWFAVFADLMLVSVGTRRRNPDNVAETA